VRSNSSTRLDESNFETSARQFLFHLRLSLTSIVLSLNNRLAYMASINWQKEIQPLLKKYKGKKHPLDYSNPYELLVAVVLSAQDSDRNINKLAPDFFKAFPDLKSLAKADEESVLALINKVRSSRKKTKWLLEIANQRRQKHTYHIRCTYRTTRHWPEIRQYDYKRDGRESGGYYS
jgi:hypothetical protein